MSGTDNLGMSEVDITDRTSSSGEEEVDIGFKDLSSPTGVPNVYVGKRNFIHQLMDVALLMANVSQLKALLSLNSSDQYYIPLFVFICMSIALQVIFTISMLAIWSIEKELEQHSIENPQKVYPNDRKKKMLADKLDKMGNILVLLVIVSNVFITGLGVEPHGFGDSSMVKDSVVPQPLNPVVVSNKTVM